MMPPSEPANLGIGKSAHGKLQRLKEDGIFEEMVHAYRFAVALALAHGAQVIEFSERQNLFHVGTVDDEKRTLYHAVAELRVETDEPVYRTMEKLATWGVEEMDRRLETSKSAISEIFIEIGHLADDAGG